MKCLNVGDNKFNAIKNALAKDFLGYLERQLIWDGDLLPKTNISRVPTLLISVESWDAEPSFVCATHKC